jgi:hypothetical protein
MHYSVRNKTRWIFLTPLLLIPIGCGGNKATVTGRVTLSKQLVDSGFVTFFPEDNRGSAVTAEIVQGEYRMEDLVPGKKRIFVSIAGEVQSDTAGVTTSRKEANAERLGERKKRPNSKQSAPINVGGNNKIVDVGSGSQQIDIPLEKLGAGQVEKK